MFTFLVRDMFIRNLTRWNHIPRMYVMTICQSNASFGILHCSGKLRKKRFINYCLV